MGRGEKKSQRTGALGTFQVFTRKLYAIEKNPCTSFLLPQGRFISWGKKGICRDAGNWTQVNKKQKARGTNHDERVGGLGLRDSLILFARETFLP